MTKRIEGYGRDEIFISGSLDGKTPYKWQPAVLFIGENGEPPKVMTHEEVSAFVHDMFKAHFDPGAFVERYTETKVVGQPYEQTVPQWISHAKGFVCAKYGIDLTK